MIITIRENISAGSFDKLVMAYNELKEGDILHIYLCTDGGDSWAADVMIDLINRHNDRTKLYGFGMLFSAGFRIFFDVLCERELIRGCVGMFHQSVMCVDLDERGVCKTDGDKARMMYLKGYSRKDTNEFCRRLGMNIEERKGVKVGDDVWFSTDRMVEIFEGIKG